ncbi:hypothetical protein DFJ74DRAFT_644504 [Hyaloraphidium curvatum]|nr:hypothetical protein DFJ74DRAFT_644504 [Hyaloraphidium curvatum]
MPTPFCSLLATCAGLFGARTVTEWLESGRISPSSKRILAEVPDRAHEMTLIYRHFCFAVEDVAQQGPVTRASARFRNGPSSACLSEPPQCLQWAPSRGQRRLNSAQTLGRLCPPLRKKPARSNCTVQLRAERCRLAFAPPASPMVQAVAGNYLRIFHAVGGLGYGAGGPGETLARPRCFDAGNSAPPSRGPLQTFQHASLWTLFYSTDGDRTREALSSGSGKDVPMVYGNNKIWIILNPVSGPVIYDIELFNPSPTFAATSTVPPSSDSTLSDLVLDQGSLRPPFVIHGSAFTNYTFWPIPYQGPTSELLLKAVTTDVGAMLGYTFNDPAGPFTTLISNVATAISLPRAGDNTVYVSVIAADGRTTSTYSIAINWQPPQTSTTEILTTSEAATMTYAATTTVETLTEAMMETMTQSATFTPTPTSFVFGAAPMPTFVAAADSNVVAGTRAGISAVVLNPDGSPAAGVAVTFNVNNVLVPGTSITDSCGSARSSVQLPVDLKAGQLLPVLPTLATGTTSSRNGTLRVYQVTAISLQLPVGVPAGDKGAINATLTDAAGRPVAAKRLVLATQGQAATLAATTNSLGLASFSYTIPAVPTPINVSWAGDGSTLGSSAAGSVPFVRPRLSIAMSAVTGTKGRDATISATLSFAANRTRVGAGRQISFSLDGAPIGSNVTGATGIASLVYRAPMQPGGNGTLLAEFTGGEDVGPSNVTAALIVKLAPVRLNRRDQHPFHSHAHGSLHYDRSPSTVADVVYDAGSVRLNFTT